MENKVICPEDLVRVLLPARMIPDKATVSKRTGEEQFALCHTLKVYPDSADKTIVDCKPLEIEGFFLVGARGGVTQVAADKLLHWVVAAETLVDVLQGSWEAELEQ